MIRPWQVLDLGTQTYRDMWTRQRVLAVVGVLAGCGRIGFDGVSTTGDARRDALADGGPAATSRHWVHVTPTVSPPAVGEMRLTYHASRGTVVGYGGWSAMTNNAQDTLWEYDGSTWRSLCTACPPGKRTLVALVYDPIRDRLVLYGGDTSTAVVGDLWEWDGTTWTQPVVSGSPPPELSRATFVWDPVGQRALLVGGVRNDDSSLTDMWSYDGTAWKRIPSNLPPLASAGPQAAWDAADARVVAYGSPLDSALDTTYTLSGATWTALCATCSGIARVDSSLVYDPGMGVLLVGGFIPSTDEIPGTWRLAGTSFEQVETDPPKRDSSGLAYDASRDVIVLFGGNGGSCGGDCDETWEYVPD